MIAPKNRRTFFASLLAVAGAALAPLGSLFGRSAIPGAAKKLSACELVNSSDGRVWAEQFCLVVGEKIPEIRNHEDWMLGWFANAIMAGWDESGRREMKVPTWDDFQSTGFAPNGEISKDQLLYQCVAIISTHPQYEKLVPQEVYEAIVRHTKEVHQSLSS